MNDDLENPFIFKTVDGIRIYNGLTQYSKTYLAKSIKLYMDSTNGVRMFTKMNPSTITAKGQISHISFHEKDIIDMLPIPTGNIMLIGCNFGVLKNTNYEKNIPAAKKKMSNRGRKKKKKPKTRRKIQGTGDFFNSQITFETLNDETKKLYKIKLFRNGQFQVPGVKLPKMTDLVNPIKTLQKYLQDAFWNPEISAEYFVSVMRNYTCRLLSKNVLIRINELEIILKKQKDTASIDPMFINVKKMMEESFIPSFAEHVMKYIGEKDNIIGMAEIQNNCERFFGLIIRFHRPVPHKMNKRTTVKILRSGKINIDGSNSVAEATELYHWLETLLIKHADDVLYQIGDVDDSGDYSVGSASSIYDDDIC